MSDPTAQRFGAAAYNAAQMSGGWLNLTLILRPEGVHVEGRAAARRLDPVRYFIQVVAWSDIAQGRIDVLDMALKDVREMLRKEV